MALLTALLTGRGMASWMELLSEPLMAQQSVRQTVLLMAQLTGRQRAWQTVQ